MRTLIAGGGEVSALIASRLIGEGNTVILIEQDGERLSGFANA